VQTPTFVGRRGFLCKALMLHESASHSRGYEHALSIVGICSVGDSVARRLGGRQAPLPEGHHRPPLLAFHLR
jgi:hypothetical protein